MVVVMNRCRNVRQPFPHIVCGEFFNPRVLDELRHQFPERRLKRRNPIHGGRYYLPNNTPEFYAWVSNNPAWQQAYNYLNSAEFVSRVLNVFIPHVDEYGPAIPVKDWVFNTMFYRRQARLLGDTWPQRSVMKRTLWLQRRNQPNGALALDLNLSIAGTGYSREIHRDSAGRLVAGVIFLDTFKGQGGALNIYQHNVQKPYHQYEPYPAPNDVTLVKTIQPRCNTAVLMLATPNAYHAVPKITHTDDWRRFVYFGITHVRGAVWQNKKQGHGHR